MDCTNNFLNIVYGDVLLGVYGTDFRYLFSYQTGGLESLVVKGKEWLYRTPKPTFWRATTDNDRGNGFPLRSGMWLSADMFLSCVDSSVTVDGIMLERPIAPINNQYSNQEMAKVIKISFTYQTITVPATEVIVSYEVNTDGKIEVEVHYLGKKGLPELPVFGMRFISPTKALGYEYEGLSGETYPDRLAGGIPGICKIEGLPVTKYMVPQDCNVHMNTKWLTIYRNTTLDNSLPNGETFELQFRSKDKEFAFSCIPYTAHELENATHQEELPPARRTVTCILGAVRGVGGIDSWGADVEPAYHISGEENIEFSFSIIPM